MIRITVIPHDGSKPYEKRFLKPKQAAEFLMSIDGKRRPTRRALDGCKAGQHLVLSGSNKCMVCGERVNRRQ